jgi:oligopeptidase A
MSEPNPLIQIQFPVPFDRIKAEHIEPAIKELLAGARARLETLGSDSLPKPLTFDATLMELDSMTDRLDYAMGVVRHLESVATYPELRAAYNAAQPEVSGFYSGIPLHAGLWNTIKTYAATDEARASGSSPRRSTTSAGTAPTWTPRAKRAWKRSTWSWPSSLQNFLKMF